jgi:hypothetical protein
VGQGRSTRLAGLPLRPAAEEVANRHSVKPISQVIRRPVGHGETYQWGSCFLTGWVDLVSLGHYFWGRSAGGGGTGQRREGPE